MKIKKKELPNRLVGRIGSYRGWLMHPRRAVRGLIAAVIGSLWLLAAAAAHIGGTISGRVATAVMQPLTAGHELVAVQATTITYLFSVPLYVALLVTAKGKLKQRSFRDVASNTEKGDRRFTWLLDNTRRFPLVNKHLVRFADWERDFRGVLKLVLPFLVSFICANLLTQYYATKLPLACGSAIGTLGPITMAMVIAWKGDNRGLPLFLPLMSAFGAAMMIPWHRLGVAGVLVMALVATLCGALFSATSAISRKVKGLLLFLPLMSAAGLAMVIHSHGLGDTGVLAGVLAALCGAVCSATMASSGKAMADAGINLKGTGLSMVAGLLLGAPFLIAVHWSWGIVTRGAIAGLFVVAAGVLYWVAQALLHLPKRLVGALSANGPAVSGLVGRVTLNQSLGLSSLAGICTILSASLLNAALTGSPDERAAERAKHHAYKDEDRAPAGDGGCPIAGPEINPENNKSPKPQRGQRRHGPKRPFDKDTRRKTKALRRQARRR